MADMAKPQQRIQFKGLNQNPDHDGDNFLGVVDELPMAATTKVAYWDRDLVEWVPTKRHVALVNPAWEGRDTSTAKDPADACWHIPTGAYADINPMEAYAPLVQELLDYPVDNEGNIDQADFLGINGAYGEVRTYRRGGEVHFDMFLPAFNVGGDGEPLVLGIQSGYDYFGSTALYTEIIAHDHASNAVLRSLTDRRSRRHVQSRNKQNRKDALSEIHQWWGEEIARLEAVTDTLFQVVVDASAFEVDLSGIPRSPMHVYRAMGLPKSLSQAAEANLSSQKFTMQASAWDYYIALAQAVTQDYQAKDDGQALRRVVRTSNRILFDPARAMSKVFSDITDELISSNATDDEIASAATQAATMADKMGQFEDQRDRLKTMLEEAQRAEEQQNDTLENHDDDDPEDEQTAAAQGGD